MNIIVPTFSNAISLLHMAETFDRYIQACTTSSLNMVSRRKYRYYPSSDYEKDMDFIENRLNTMVKSINPHLRKLIRNQPVIVIPMEETAENGMPHTRFTNIICIPYSRLKSSHRLFETFEHELWHIHQKRNPLQWNTFFTQRWNFKQWNGPLPLKLQDKVRMNPDTLDNTTWVWNNEWVAIPLFTNITFPTLSDVDVWFYNINTKRIQKDIPTAMKLFFSNKLHKISYEHPREISAYLLSEGSKINSSPALKIIQKELE